MKTKLLRKLRRLARQKIKIEYVTPDYLYITLYNNILHNKLYWYEQSEEFLVGYNSIEKEIAFGEHTYGELVKIFPEWLDISSHEKNYSNNDIIFINWL